MSHYPTSAELASFRRSIVENDEPAHATGTRCPVLDPECEPFAVFPDELRHGIGYRAAEGYMPEYVKPDPGQPWDGYHVTMSANDADRVYATRARREASRMRSRAYAPSIYSGLRHAALLEIAYGTPTGMLVGERINAAALASV